MNVSRRGALAGSAAVFASAVAGCSTEVKSAPQQTSSGAPNSSPVTKTTTAAVPFELRSRAETVAKFGSEKPDYWGFFAPGVLTQFPTTAAGHDAVALTFDACGGHLTKYDADLIATLRKHNAAATLFINSEWAQHNPTIFKELLADPLFEIENHGTRHVPLSVTGRSAYGIVGTKDVGEAWQEVAGCFEYMASTWDHRPRFMRVGTAYTDDVAARAAEFAGQRIVSFHVNGDAGATFPANVVAQQVALAKPGQIVISHMNRPGSGTEPGYQRAIPALVAEGISFVHLRDVL